MEAITIDVVSDVVCPWCYLGKKRLEQAIEAVKDDLAVAVTFRPYQLNPDMPAEGVDHKKHLAEKLGGEEAVARAHEMLAGLGQEAGIDFDFPAVKISPNTLDAHRLLRWAMIEGPEVQSRVAVALFKAYFEEGRNVGDRAVLLDIAEACGMDRAVVTALFSAGADVDSVKEEIGMARDMGVTGVPCFIIDNKYAVMGAQSVDVLTNAFREIAALKAQERIGKN
ncbi:MULTISPECIES: DsbA family oxidoreductase [unclassified Shinella]|uniref:DsbA family oxidoreductase n=1 Tax=unclassified Shinella TaxID=2643062 RepID=UPI0003C5415A|nr:MULTISPECIES: DsbA family oxidoreductase [unclassified Shinella]EYR79927.1 putative Dsb family thioredoxin protein Dsb [Shinella sp. DD12]MCO5149934.1 DsbA family oxidoreductase [Shinella sp.]MDC7262158.1 DsbA family oxidoreductase [Shinella sp. HY16]MDC7269053.1 DsbA family oxidoreductase [Shinella sp. YZ44]MDG4670947.1 DsbA family oxidoreductase [Shinella sp. 838]